MKKTILLALIMTIISMIMTQTAVAVPVIDGCDDVCCLSASGMVGAIRPCPRCGGTSLHTCGGPNNTYAPDEYCTLHSPCVKTNCEQYKTFARCYHCGYGDGVGGGTGYADPHVEYEYHTYTRQTYNVCLYGEY